jgi:hypothetical protein
MLPCTYRSLAIISSLCSTTVLTTCSLPSWTLSTTSSASSHVRLISWSSILYFLFFIVSLSYASFLFVCEHFTFIVFPWPVFFGACVVSCLPVHGQLPIIATMGILLGLFGTALLPLGIIRVVVVLVLSAELPVRADEPASFISLGLVDCVVPILVASFSIGSCHYVGHSFLIHSTCSLVTQYYIFSHSFLGSFASWIHI